MDYDAGMSTLERIAADLLALTPEDVSRMGAALLPPEQGETVICVVESFQARALWTLATDYERRRHMAAHSAEFDASDTISKAALNIEAQRFTRLNAIAEWHTSKLW